MGAAIDVTEKNKLSVTLIATKSSKIETADSAESTSETRRISPATSLTLQQREHAVHRGRRGKSKMLQGQLPLTLTNKSRFDGTQPTIYNGEDLDVATFIRRGIPLN